MDYVALQKKLQVKNMTWMEAILDRLDRCCDVTVLLFWFSFLFLLLLLMLVLLLLFSALEITCGLPLSCLTPSNQTDSQVELAF